jgi:two-component sensor histidine kinase
MHLYRISGWRAYLVAAGLVGIAAICRYSLELVSSGAFYYALFFPAIGAATLLSGSNVGFFSLVLTNVVVWIAFMPPRLTFSWPSLTDWTNIAQFSISGGLLIWLTEQYRRALEALTAEERRRRLITDELVHRSRNSLTIASTVVSRTLASQPDTAKQLIARINVLLGPEHVELEPTSSRRPLRHVFLAGLKPYGAERFALVGDELEIEPRQARDLALIVHELATNSVKYGALSAPNGFLTVKWQTDNGFAVIDWIEKGRSKTEVHSSTGFGTKLIDTMVRDLHGTIERQLEPIGFRCRIAFPIRTGEMSLAGQGV